MSEVKISGLTKAFGSVQVLHGIDVTIPAGQMTVLLGPSGCGKSTLLRLIAGLEKEDSGSIFIDGINVSEVKPKDRGCAMVFQNYALYPHMTVYQNLAFPLVMARQKKEVIARRVEETARSLQIDMLLDRLPRQLSGGQRQRVAMGRAIIRQPKVFLFDEPLSNLDAELRVRMRLEIARMQSSLNATMVFVTHDQVEAMTLAHQIVVMRGGYIEQVAAPLDLYRRPATRFVASFIGTPSMNIFSLAGLLSCAVNSKLLEQRIVNEMGAVVREIGFRPEHVLMREGGEGDLTIHLAPGDFEVVGKENLGDRAYLYLRASFGEVTLQIPEDAEINLAEVTFSVPFDLLHFFDEIGARVDGVMLEAFRQSHGDQTQENINEDSRSECHTV